MGPLWDLECQKLAYLGTVWHSSAPLTLWLAAPSRYITSGSIPAGTTGGTEGVPDYGDAFSRLRVFFRLQVGEDVSVAWLLTHTYVTEIGEGR